MTFYDFVFVHFMHGIDQGPRTMEEVRRGVVITAFTVPSCHNHCIHYAELS